MPPATLSDMLSATLPAKDTPFTLGIAGLRVSVSCQPKTLNSKLRARYRKFLTHAEAQVEAQVQLVGDLRPHPLLGRGTLFEGERVRFSAPGFQGGIDPKRGTASLQLSSASPIEEVDYFIRVIYALLAFGAGGMLFHSAGIVREGQAFLFFGPSGSGKTTVSRLSSDYLTLNDDLLVLLPLGDGWQVYGTPFWNPSQTRPSSQHAPLAGLFRLVQDKDVYLKKMSKSRALAELAGSVPVIPLSGRLLPPLLERLAGLANAIPIYHLHFLPDDSFWEVIRESGTSD